MSETRKNTDYVGEPDINEQEVVPQLDEKNTQEIRNKFYELVETRFAAGTQYKAAPNKNEINTSMHYFGVKIRVTNLLFENPTRTIEVRISQRYPDSFELFNPHNPEFGCLRFNKHNFVRQINPELTSSTIIPDEIHMDKIPCRVNKESGYTLIEHPKYPGIKLIASVPFACPRNGLHETAFIQVCGDETFLTNEGAPDGSTIRYKIKTEIIKQAIGLTGADHSNKQRKIGISFTPDCSNRELAIFILGYLFANNRKMNLSTDSGMLKLSYIKNSFIILTPELRRIAKSDKSIEIKNDGTCISILHPFCSYVQTTASLIQQIQEGETNLKFHSIKSIADSAEEMKEEFFLEKSEYFKAEVDKTLNAYYHTPYGKRFSLNVDKLFYTDELSATATMIRMNDDIHIINENHPGRGYLKVSIDEFCQKLAIEERINCSSEFINTKVAAEEIVKRLYTNPERLYSADESFAIATRLNNISIRLNARHVSSEDKKTKYRIEKKDGFIMVSDFYRPEKGQFLFSQLEIEKSIEECLISNPNLPTSTVSCATQRLIKPKTAENFQQSANRKEKPSNAKEAVLTGKPINGLKTPELMDKNPIPDKIVNTEDEALETMIEFEENPPKTALQMLRLKLAQAQLNPEVWNNEDFVTEFIRLYPYSPSRIIHEAGAKRVIAYMNSGTISPVNTVLSLGGGNYGEHRGWLAAKEMLAKLGYEMPEIYNFDWSEQMLSLGEKDLKASHPEAKPHRIKGDMLNHLISTLDRNFGTPDDDDDTEYSPHYFRTDLVECFAFDSINKDLWKVLKFASNIGIITHPGSMVRLSNREPFNPNLFNALEREGFTILTGHRTVYALKAEEYAEIEEKVNSLGENGKAYVRYIKDVLRNTYILEAVKKGEPNWAARNANNHVSVLTTINGVDVQFPLCQNPSSNAEEVDLGYPKALPPAHMLDEVAVAIKETQEILLQNMHPTVTTKIFSDSPPEKLN